MIRSVRWLSVVTFALLLFGATPAQALVECDHTFGAVTIDDDVLVKDKCVLHDTIVNGDIFVVFFGWLDAYRVTVYGNIIADGPFLFRLADSYVEDHVEVLYCGYDTPCGIIRSNIGSLAVSYSGPPYGVRENTVRGDVTNLAGIYYFSSNHVEGNFTCEPSDTGFDIAVFKDNDIEGTLDPSCFE